jgi:hypothetical protein
MEPAPSEFRATPGKVSPSAGVLLVDDEALIRWASSALPHGVAK